jgi:hypothetical protein
VKTLIVLFILSLFTLRESPRFEKEEALWYSVKFQSLCEELDRVVTPERALKYGNMTAYWIRQDTLALDTIRVSFDFISNCCEKFESNAEMANDTLNVSYYKTNAETCRCICDYRFTYTISDTTKTWSGVKVHRKKSN